MNLTPFAELSPDFVLDAVSALGFEPDGRLMALNSFENRVYQVGIEGDAPLIAKFYRPGRWTDAAIREEHAFAHELVEAELPVVAPLPVGGVEGYTHCGFSPEQSAAAWEALRGWVETGTRPAVDAVK